MFNHPFSFDGRIRRTEYGLSFIFYLIGYGIITAMIAGGGNSGAGILALAYIPLVWFLWAQGAKRCHDIGNSGWWQIIPFYVLLLIFKDGQAEANEYGENYKNIENPNKDGLNNVSEFEAARNDKNSGDDDFYTDTDNIEVGTKCFTNETMTIPLPDGNLVTASGDTITIVSGVVVLKN